MNNPGTQKYKVITSNTNDLDFIFLLFETAIQYQKIHGYDLWPQFSRSFIEKEISEGRHWKITDGENIVCVFSVLYNDPLIWKEKDLDPSVYLHRIAINPLYKGNGIMNFVKLWAIDHAKENKKQFVRMDTWGQNENLRNYYIKCGFKYLGQQHLNTVNGQPIHYGGSLLSLFQLEV